MLKEFHHSWEDGVLWQGNDEVEVMRLKV